MKNLSFSICVVFVSIIVYNNDADNNSLGGGGNFTVR